MKCRACGTEAQPGVRFCGSCGRSLVVVTEPARSGTVPVLAGLLVVGLITMAAVAVVRSRFNSLPSRGGSAADAPQEFPKRRMFCENYKPDDSTRAATFQMILKRTGERCDSVDSALSEPPCNWVVRCAPGYSYRFEFNTDGDIQGAQRIR